jgi:hypothetical protein
MRQHESVEEKGIEETIEVIAEIDPTQNSKGLSAGYPPTRLRVQALPYRDA